MEQKADEKTRETLEDTETTPTANERSTAEEGERLEEAKTPEKKGREEDKQKKKKGGSFVQSIRLA